MPLVPTLAVALALTLTGCGGHAKGSGEGAVEKAAAAGEEGHPEEGSAEGSVLNLETFIVNLAEAGGGRYVKCTFKLELNGKEALEAIQSEEVMIPRIRDKILTLLSSRTADSLMTVQGKEILKREVESRVGPLLRVGKIRDVYITDFLVQ